MKENFISVTEAARNFADCVNRARYQNVTFVLLKNGAPVARLVPEPGAAEGLDKAKVCSGRKLAVALAESELPGLAARAWRRELQAGRKTMKAPASRW